uniref:Ribonuclease R n=1 Tax=Schlesneria paludicola TaxID=360056 RepID=A0A7C4LL91_9PLAN
MPDFSRQILHYFEQPEARPQRPKELARWLRIKQSQAAPFLAAIETLIEAGQLHRAANGTISKARPPSAVGLTGTIRRTSRGVGYFTPAVSLPEGSDSELAAVQVEEPVYIAPEDLAGALTGDEVRVVLLKRRRSHGQRCGRVVEVLRRARSTFVGVYHELHGRGFVTVDAAVFDEPVAVGDPGAKGARPNDKVVFEMVQFPTPKRAAEGVIIQVLGPRGKPGVDTLSIIHEFQLPDEFPEAVLEEARAQAERFDPDDLRGRLDLTGETIITIDPVDARDFDDAISLTQSPDGHWRLGVHIADVAHFVPSGSDMDREARRRGNSVYLPDRVLPMLPEVLSNGLASLQQDHVRYTKSVFIDFTPDGVPTHTELANSAIKVTRRFAYEEVLPILQHPSKHGRRIPAPVRALLERMHRLAMILRKRRFARGALDLQLPEVKLDLDKDGQVCGAHRVLHDESHQIIEEFMLAANIAVAQTLARRGLAYLHRVHAPPDEKKLRDLGEFVRGLGLSARPWLGRRELQALLDQVRGRPTEYPISYALLRSLKQAEYSPADIGHFALAEEDYCHFTSPIRRYPDLTVHRLVDALLRDPGKVRAPSEAELVRLGEHCSETERRADAAERELIKVKLLAFLSTRIGWQMEATITGVERFGLFCQGQELPAEGLVHVNTLPPDQYEYDARRHTLLARRSGTLYRLGDIVRVEVAAVDLHRRLLELTLVAGRKSRRRS